jgi:hypothetical protein
MRGDSSTAKSFSSALKLGLLLASLSMGSTGSVHAADLCPMCYTTASSAARSTVHALRSGTMMLAIPPMLLFGGMIAVALRWRKEPNTQDEMHSGERPS